MSVILSVCPHVKNEMAETKIVKLGTWTVYHPSINIR